MAEVKSGEEKKAQVTVGLPQLYAGLQEVDQKLQRQHENQLALVVQLRRILTEGWDAILTRVTYLEKIVLPCTKSGDQHEVRQTLFNLKNAIERDEMLAALGTLEKKVQEQFEERKQPDLSGRLEQIEKRFEALEQFITGVQDRMQKLEDKFLPLNSLMDKSVEDYKKAVALVESEFANLQSRAVAVPSRPMVATVPAPRISVRSRPVVKEKNSPDKDKVSDVGK